MKAVVLVVSDGQASDVASLIAAALSLNGYRHDGPEIIEWPAAPPVAQRPTLVLVEEIAPGSPEDLFNRADPGCELCEGRGRYLDGQGCETQCPCTFVGAST